MKNLVLTFGILSVILLQATALPGSPSSFEPGSSESDAGKVIDLNPKTIGPLSVLYNTFQGFFDTSPSIPLESWCGEVLRDLKDKEKEIGMDLFVTALCEKNSDSGKPSVSINQLLDKLKELPPKKLLPYVEGILKQWGYIIHKDYQAAPGPEVRSEEDIEGPKESSSGQSHVVNGSEETGRNQNVNQGQLGLQFPKGQFNKVVHPMSDNQFQVQWVNIFEASDLDLLRLSPYFLMFKHGKFFDLHLVYKKIWQVLTEYLLKGPGSVLKPVAKSYPQYFHTDVDSFSSSVDEPKSVWGKSIHYLISIMGSPFSRAVPPLEPKCVWGKNLQYLIRVMGAPFSLAVPLLREDYDKLKETLRLLMDISQPQSDKDKMNIAYLLYFITQKLNPNVEERVNEVLTGFLGIQQFNVMEAYIKKKREDRVVFELPLLKILQNLLWVVDRQVKVAIVDIHSST
ncbi:hypothetical protein IWQ61_009646 [Dispira simplex]|nr:hypothetical protein IWQ61_009646 [Dispira simplex]